MVDVVPEKILVTRLAPQFFVRIDECSLFDWNGWIRAVIWSLIHEVKRACCGHIVVIHGELEKLILHI